MFTYRLSGALSPAGGRCPECRARATYGQALDAVFCRPCDAWLESRCPDPDCECCAHRPRRPSEVSFLHLPIWWDEPGAAEQEELERWALGRRRRR